MNHLLRERAPITEAGWAELDGEARTRLEPGLAARKVVDFAGPPGWDYSATNLGRIETLTGGEGVQAARRIVLPLVELRVEFALSRHELADLERGAEDIDLEPLEEAARRLAVAENTAVFHGWEAAGIRGHRRGVRARGDLDQRGLQRLHPPHRRGRRDAAAQRHHGPVRARARAGRVHRRDPDRRARRRAPVRPPQEDPPGRPDRLGARRPRRRGRVLRGGDFLFESGQDLSIGYTDHDAETVSLYLEESFSFRVATPEAACSLTPAG